MGKEALVVERKALFGDLEFQGFLPRSERDFISTIVSNHYYHERGDDLENNVSLQQVITYVWIVNPQDKSVFLYKRKINDNKKNGEYREMRYLNKYSGGVGGHIDRDTEEGSDDPIMNAMMRELKEEVIMQSYPSPKIIGYVNDDSDSIGSVHFGIVGIVESNEDVKAREDEGLGSGKFYSIEEVDRIFNDAENDVEGWTLLSWPFVKSYLESHS